MGVLVARFKCSLALEPPDAFPAINSPQGGWGQDADDPWEKGDMHTRCKTQRSKNTSGPGLHICGQVNMFTVLSKSNADDCESFGEHEPLSGFVNIDDDGFSCD